MATGAGSTGLAVSEGTAGVSAGTAASEAGFSRGATGVGSSILGGCSLTLAVVGTSDLDFLKRSPTRADRRRENLLLVSFFSSFCNEKVSFKQKGVKEKEWLTCSSGAGASASTAGVSTTGVSLIRVLATSQKVYA